MNSLLSNTDLGILQQLPALSPCAAEVFYSKSNYSPPYLKICFSFKKKKILHMPWVKCHALRTHSYKTKAQNPLLFTVREITLRSLGEFLMGKNPELLIPMICNLQFALLAIISNYSFFSLSLQTFRLLSITDFKNEYKGFLQTHDCTVLKGNN